MAKTGLRKCEGSPYEDAASVMFELNKDYSSWQFQAAAAEERDFLISLLPEGETWS